MKILSNEIMADIKSAAWLEAELHPHLDLHRRHEMADICEKGSVERIWRVCALAVAEVGEALRRLLRPPAAEPGSNILEYPPDWTFSFRLPLEKYLLSFLNEKIHEYIVARVMFDRTRTIIPDAAPAWKERADSALECIRAAAYGALRRGATARRPMWPM